MTDVQTTKGKIPYLEDGSIPHYLDYDHKYYDHNAQCYRPVKWMDPEPFYAVVVIDDFHHGRSGLHVTVMDLATGAKYPLFTRHFLELLQKGNFQEATGLLIDGKWGIRKQGANYSIFPIFDDK